ncbi:MAG: hypothetical protein ACRDKJ_10660 [Actinomycetota bacterium]
MIRTKVATAVAISLLAAACGSGSTTIGPLTLDVPDGWQVSDREGGNLKLTDGTIADPTATRAGTATAVFDIFVDSAQTPEKFLEYLREQKIEAGKVKTTIGGAPAEIFSYEDSSVGGRQEAVFIPRWRVFILYRAAFRDDDAAFFRGRDAFRRALESVTFSGTSTGGSASIGRSRRHGPTSGNSASTAIAAPAAIITNPI